MKIFTRTIKQLAGILMLISAILLCACDDETAGNMSADNAEYNTIQSIYTPVLTRNDGESLYINRSDQGLYVLHNNTHYSLEYKFSIKNNVVTALNDIITYEASPSVSVTKTVMDSKNLVFTIEFLITKGGLHNINLSTKNNVERNYEFRSANGQIFNSVYTAGHNNDGWIVFKIKEDALPKSTGNIVIRALYNTQAETTFYKANISIGVASNLTGLKNSAYSTRANYYDYIEWIINVSNDNWNDFFVDNWLTGNAIEVPGNLTNWGYYSPVNSLEFTLNYDKSYYDQNYPDNGLIIGFRGGDHSIKIGDVYWWYE